MSDYASVEEYSRFLGKRAKIRKPCLGYSRYLWGKSGKISSVNGHLFLEFDVKGTGQELHDGVYLTPNSFELEHCNSSHVKDVVTKYGKKVRVCKCCGVVE